MFDHNSLLAFRRSFTSIRSIPTSDYITSAAFKRPLLDEHAMTMANSPHLLAGGLVIAVLELRTQVETAARPLMLSLSRFLRHPQE